MSRLSNMWTSMTRSGNDHDAYLRLSPAQILDTPASHAAKQFVPHHTYFEIRLKQMFLRDRREYAREFIAVSSFNTEFLFAGQRTQTPLVVGPSMLSSVQQLGSGEQIEFLNTRLIGPCPYEGDDIELFAGLFRMTSNDWAKRALSLLEVLGKAFDTSRLSTMTNLASPLATGIEGFFGMKDIELRLGKHISFAAPGAGTRGQGSLQPTTFALFRMPRSKMNPQAEREFWVKDGRLFHGESADTAQEFRDCDFMLLELLPLASRSDFSSFEFHRKYWRKIEALLVEQRVDEARATFRLLAANLAQCDDIVRAHRFNLLEHYRRWMDESIANYAQLFAPTPEPTRGQDRRTEGGSPKAPPSRTDTTRSGKASTSLGTSPAAARPPARPASRPVRARPGATPASAPPPAASPASAPAPTEAVRGPVAKAVAYSTALEAKPVPSSGISEAELGAAATQTSRGGSRVMSPEEMFASIL